MLLCALALAAPAAASWDKLLFSIGNDNKLADVAAGPGGAPIVAVGTAADGMGGSGPVIMYSTDGSAFSQASAGGGGMAIPLGVAATGTDSFVAVRTRFEMGLPPTITGEVLRSTTGGRSFLQVSSLDGATLTGVEALTDQLVVTWGSVGSDSAPTLWISTEGGANPSSLSVPAAGAHVSVLRASVLAPACIYAVGGDAGEQDEEGNEIRPAGSGALWIGDAAGGLTLVQQGLTPCLSAVDFPSPQVGYLGGWQGDTAYLARTEDGGQGLSWLTLPQHSGNDPTGVFGIRCFDTQRCAVLLGYGSGDSPAPSFVAFTGDGGQSFSLDTSSHDGLSFFEQASGLYAMDFVDPDTALVAGENHMVMRYTGSGSAPESRSSCAGGADAGAFSDAALEDGGGQPGADAGGGAGIYDGGGVPMGDVNPGGCGCGGHGSQQAPLPLLAVLLLVARAGRCHRRHR